MPLTCRLLGVSLKLSGAFPAFARSGSGYNITSLPNTVGTGAYTIPYISSPGPLLQQSAYTWDANRTAPIQTMNLLVNNVTFTCPRDGVYEMPPP